MSAVVEPRAIVAGEDHQRVFFKATFLEDLPLDGSRCIFAQPLSAEP